VYSYGAGHCCPGKLDHRSRSSPHLEAQALSCLYGAGERWLSAATLWTCSLFESTRLGIGVSLYPRASGDGLSSETSVQILAGVPESKAAAAAPELAVADQMDRSLAWRV